MADVTTSQRAISGWKEQVSAYLAIEKPIVEACKDKLEAGITEILKGGRDNTDALVKACNDYTFAEKRLKEENTKLSQLNVTFLTRQIQELTNAINVGKLLAANPQLTAAEKKQYDDSIKKMQQTVAQFQKDLTSLKNTIDITNMNIKMIESTLAIAQSTMDKSSAALVEYTQKLKNNMDAYDACKVLEAASASTSTSTTNTSDTGASSSSTDTSTSTSTIGTTTDTTDAGVGASGISGISGLSGTI